jgi:hypothetical protein
MLLSIKLSLSKNKGCKIINQLVVETLKGNNITQEGIYVGTTVIFGHFVMICMHIKLTNA